MRTICQVQFLLTQRVDLGFFGGGGRGGEGVC